MTELHAVVARQSSTAERARRDLTEFYKQAGHGPLFMGGTREMRSIHEEVPDEQAEITLPPLTAQSLFRRVEKVLAEAWDLTATRDRSNMDATADIVVDGRTFAEGVPVSTLLSLEKQLADLRTVIKSMPVRDPSKVWTLDEGHGFYRAPETRKARTRKVIRAAELSPATDRHPAQVHAFNTDEVVGHYITTEYSGALSMQDKESLVDRVNKAADAVKTARTEANRTEVTDLRVSDLLRYIFTG